jgi:hypothetical protein
MDQCLRKAVARVNDIRASASVAKATGAVSEAKRLATLARSAQREADRLRGQLEAELTDGEPQTAEVHD